MKVFVSILLVVIVVAALAESVCDSGWLEFGGKCFLFRNGDDRRSWDDARRECSRWNAALVRIPDEATNNFIMSTLQSTSGSSGVWIGISDFYTRGQDHWDDGTPVSDGYSNWLYERENPVNFWRCAYMRRTTGKWERTWCELGGGNFICEK